jgi:hypothetical protein
MRPVHLALLLPFALGACRSYHGQYLDLERKAAAALPSSAPILITEADLLPLPPPVQRYLRYSGALGKPRTQEARLRFDAEMIRKPGDPPMPATAEQHDFFGPGLQRLFFMRARMAGLPVRVLHAYGNGDASMQVRVLGLFPVVSLHGVQLLQAETVTVLNDMCLLAPGSLLDPRLHWRALDARHAEVTLQNGALHVEARLSFDADGALVNFESDDRYALGDDGILQRRPFSTPVKDYKDYGGWRLASYGEAIYQYPDGPFIYGRFWLKEAVFGPAH